MSQKTVAINGTLYDAHTGLPLVEASKVSTHHVNPVKHATTSQTVHTSTQRSKTLNRSTVKKSSPHNIDGMVRRHPAIVTKSPLITKFAPHPAGARIARKPTHSDIGPVTHPLQHKVNSAVAVKKNVVAVSKPAQAIKNEAITNALKNTGAKDTSSHKQQPKRRSRFFSVASASLALLLLAGYFTYINMPNLSVRVASSQAGIAASYPEYKPDGYSLNGAVAYTQGEVSMKFASNSGSSDYTIRQSKSSWDSSAVLDNYTRENKGIAPTTYTERGLTIYIDGTNATWVNRGILYTIKGDAPLSTEQIRHIATSM
ncbi:MAG: DUF4367 domain-containing protein [Candidatus Saccharimonadales bacterium]